MNQNKQLAGLDLIRFAAAMMVMMFHLGFWIWSGSVYFHDGGSDVAYHWLAPLTCFGWIGVEIFFVLSGFVIAYSAEGSSAPDFVRGRIIRLYPSAWICSTLTLCVVLVSGISGHHGWEWLRAFLLSPSGPWIDSSYWTLGVELGFYVVVFLVLFAGRFHKIGAVMGTIGIMSAVVSVIFWYLQHSSVKVFGGTSFKAYYRGYWWFLMLLTRHGTFFAIGTLLWLCLFHKVTMGRFVAILLSVVGGLFEIAFHWERTVRNGGYYFPLFVPAGLWLLTLLAVIASVKYKSSIDQALGVRGARLFKNLGLMTYPLYLIHSRIGYFLIPLGKGHIPDFTSLVVVVCLLLTAAYFISKYPDRLLQRALRRLLWQSSRPASPTVYLTHPK